MGPELKIGLFDSDADVHYDLYAWWRYSKHFPRLPSFQMDSIIPSSGRITRIGIVAKLWLLL